MKKEHKKDSFLSSYLSFIKTKSFFIHLGLSVFTLFISMFLLFKFLNFYTDHGDKVEVPDFSEKSIFELEKFLEDKDIKFEITDSVYLPKSKPGVVIKQEPKKGSFVKPGRTVYLYISTILPPKMEMPQLVDRSYRQATFMIQSYGLKLGKTTYEVGFPGAVLKQIVDGKEYTAEQIKEARKKNNPIMIRKGSKISLVVGKEEEIVLDTISK
ncbi:MAG: PASTA domain-containing protein [Bacteroidota bacterium]